VSCGRPNPRCFPLQLDRSECPRDVLENGVGIAFWDYPNRTTLAKVLGIFFAEDTPQNQNRRAGTSHAEIIENRRRIEFRRMVPHKYEIERRGLYQLAGFRFVPSDRSINICLFECVLQLD